MFFEYLRKHAASLFMKIVLGIIALVFVFWGIGSFTNKKIKNYAVKINDEIILPQEFYRQLDNVIKSYEKQFHITLSEKMIKQFHIKENVLQDMINKRILYMEAVKHGIIATDEEVRRAIITLPYFQENGVFKKSLYLRVLRYNRITPEEFEDRIRYDITISKFKNAIANSVLVTDKETKELFEYEDKKVKLGYIRIPYSKFLDKVKYTEKDLKNFYNQNKNFFKVPEKRDIDYLEFSKNYFLKQLKISNKEIKEYYKTHINEFKIPTEIKARHILIKPKDKSIEADKAALKEIEKIREMALKGKDFGELAKKYSQGPSAKNGGELGWFKRGEMVPEFEKVVFSLKKGEISKPFKTKFGWHIVQVEDIKKGRTKSLKEVKNEIIKKLQKEKVNKLMKNFAKKYKDIKNITTIAKKLNLKIKHLKGISEDNDTLDFRLIQKTFQLKINQTAFIPGNYDNPIYIVKLVKITPSYIPKFNNIKDKVIAKYKQEEAKKLALAKAKILLSKIKNTNDLKKLADSKNIIYNETNFIPYHNPTTPDLPGVNLSNIDKLKLHQVLKEVLSNYDSAFIVGIVKFNKFDKEKYKKVKNKIKQFIWEQKANYRINRYLENVKKHYKIDINEKILL